MNGRLPAVLALAFLVAACVGDGSRPSALPETTIAPPSKATSATPTAGERIENRAIGAPGRAPRPVVTPPGRANLVQLVGLQGPELALLLGLPTLKRQEPPAEVWQYVGRSCALHVFFYLDPAQGGYRVVHVESIDRGGARSAGDDFLDRLLEEAKNAGRSS